MSDLEILMSDVADYVEHLLQQRPAARDDLIRLRKADQEPNIFRVLMPDTMVLIRFQDVPE